MVIGSFFAKHFSCLRVWQLTFVFAAIWALLLSPTLLNGAPFLYFDSENYISRPLNAAAAVARRIGATLPAGSLPRTAPTTDAEAEAASSEAARPEAAERPAPQDRLVLRGQPAAQDHMVLRGRSIHYGFFALAGALVGGFWGSVLLQGALTAAVIVLAARRLQLRAATAMAVAAACALLTPAGVFVGLVMPDFLAPLTVATLALLALDPGGIPTRERLLLAAAAVLAMASHTSHLALGLALVGIAGMVHVFGLLRGAITRHGLMLAFAAVGVAILLGGGTDQAMRRVLGIEMFNRPHFSAHLLDAGGPGIGFLETQCAATPDRFQLCAYRDRFPLEWRAFLFDRTAGVGVFAAADVPSAERRRISRQDREFALAVLGDRPAETLRYATAEFLEQMTRFRFDAVPITGESLARFRDRLPGFLADDPAARDGNVDLALLRTIDTFTKGMVGLALAGLIAAAALRLTGPTFPASGAAAERWAFGMLLLIGLVLNAAICGILAAPYDRFQARVIVLLPLAAACLLAAVAVNRTRTRERIA